MRTIRYYLYRDYPRTFRQYIYSLDNTIKRATERKIKQLRARNNIIANLGILLLSQNLATNTFINSLVTLGLFFLFFASHSILVKLLVWLATIPIFLAIAIAQLIITPKIKISSYQIINNYKDRNKIDNNQKIIVDFKQAIEQIKDKTIIINCLFYFNWGLLFAFLCKKFTTLIDNPVPWNSFFNEIYSLLSLSFITTNSFGTVFFIIFLITAILWFFRRLCPIVWLEKEISTLARMNN